MLLCCGFCSALCVLWSVGFYGEYVVSIVVANARQVPLHECSVGVCPSIRTRPYFSYHVPLHQPIRVSIHCATLLPCCVFWYVLCVMWTNGFYGGYVVFIVVVNAHHVPLHECSVGVCPSIHTCSSPPPPPHLWWTFTEGKGREGQRMAICQWAPPAADENTRPWLLAKPPPPPPSLK